MSTPYERGLDREFEAAQGEEGEDESAQAERAAYREVEARLGRGAHAWETFDVMERDMTRLKHEHLSAAFHSAILPPALDDALHLASTLRDKLAPFELADLALNCFLELVQARAGETAFRGTWPIGVPQPSQEMLSLPDEVVKDRLLRYWRDVVAHYFQHAAPAASSALSALFLRILLPLKHLARSPAADVPLAAFLRSSTDSVLSEGTRIRLAAASLDKLAVAKVLERASLEKRPILHVLAAGNDPLVAGVLRELVHYVTTISAHPYGTVNPHVQAITHAAQVEWSSRPNALVLTLFESRPLCTGAALAARLHQVVHASRDKADQLCNLSTSYENPWRAHPLGPPAGPGGGLPDRVLHALDGGDGALSDDGVLAAQLGESYGELGRLLGRAEGRLFGRPPPSGLGGAKVQLCVAADNAAASVLSGIKARGEGQAVVLLGAEAVLPGKGGDVRAPIGSWMLAETAKKLGAKVFVVALVDQILSSSSTSTAASRPRHDPTELLAGWSGTLAEELESLDALALAAANPLERDVNVFADTSEIVPGHLIDGYVTEKGFLSATGCDLLGRERALAERELYET
ncbi:hypothetical protein JCM9279_005182 [Rhodotorula babjevae]